MEINDFKVLRDSVWSDEKTKSIFLFELEQKTLPNIKKHLGPQLERQIDCEKFLSKYLTDKQVLAGPYVEDGRWVVEVPRKYTDATVLIKEKLSENAKNVGVSELIAAAVAEEFKVLADKEILKIYTEHSDFAVFLTAFLSGKPFWLVTH